MKKSFIVIAIVFATCAVWAQNDVSLVVSGEGQTKDEATFNALRSAIEQAFGTFISSNTTVLNDKVIQDEIVSLSSGNIKSYEYITENKLPNGNTYVTLSTTVSVDKLTSFCESKGMDVEFKGALFAINHKKKEFDKIAEEKAVENLITQLSQMFPSLYDYLIEVGEGKPSYRCDTILEFPVAISLKANDNTRTFFDIYYSTLKSISLTIDDWKKLKEEGYKPKELNYLTTKYYHYYDFDRNREMTIKRPIDTIVQKSFPLKLYGGSWNTTYRCEFGSMYELRTVPLRSQRSVALLNNFCDIYIEKAVHNFLIINSVDTSVIYSELDRYGYLINKINNVKINIDCFYPKCLHGAVEDCGGIYGFGWNENDGISMRLFMYINQSDLSKISNISVRKNFLSQDEFQRIVNQQHKILFR